jgi:hypothetical protein
MKVAQYQAIRYAGSHRNRAVPLTPPIGWKEKRRGAIQTFEDKALLARPFSGVPDGWCESGQGG